MNGMAGSLFSLTLPESAAEAADALESSATLAHALGPELHDAILTVRRSEHERRTGLTEDQLAEAFAIIDRGLSLTDRVVRG